MRDVWYWLLTLCLVLGAWVPGYTAVPADFRFLAPLVGDLPPDAPVRLPLPRQVMEEAQPGFAGVRLFDDQGVETPYVVYPRNAPPPSMVVLRVLAYSQDQEGESIVLHIPPDTGPVSELLVQTSARDFHKAVRLQASHDQETWSDVTSDALFDFSSRIDVRKTTLVLPATAAPYLRLLLKEATPPRSDATGLQLRYEGLEFVTRGGPARPFRIDQISARVGTPQATDDLYEHATFASPAMRTTTPGQTLVLLGHLNVPIARLTLNAENPYYHRRVEIWGAEADQDDAYQQVASGMIYKLPGVASAETTLQVQLRPYAYVRLKILNADNPPLRLQSVDIAWVRHHLYFIPAAGRRYTLYFGSVSMRPPVYELHGLIPARHAALEQYAMVGLGEVQPHLQYAPSPGQGRKGQIEKGLLTALLLLLTAGLGWWAYRLLKVVTKPGS